MSEYRDVAAFDDRARAYESGRHARLHFEIVHRTEADADARVALAVSHAGATVAIEMPDRSGDQLRNMIDTRLWDPQLQHLNWLTEVTGTKIGRWPVAEVPVKLSATPAHVGSVLDRGAPCYGEDNEWVLGELLGYGSKEIAELEDDGVI